MFCITFSVENQKYSGKCCCVPQCHISRDGCDEQQGIYKRRFGCWFLKKRSSSLSTTHSIMSISSAAWLMTEEDVFKTSHIASARIVVEMKMEQAKLTGVSARCSVIRHVGWISFGWTNGIHLFKLLGQICFLHFSKSQIIVYCYIYFFF